jgi:hypothetical protein
MHIMVIGMFSKMQRLGVGTENKTMDGKIVTI